MRQLSLRRLFFLTAMAAAWAGQGLVTLAQPADQPVLPAPQSVWSGVYSEVQAYAGEKVADTACLGCHGAGLAGGDSGPKLVGGNFLAGWDGKSVGDLFDWILEKMPENAPGTMKPDEVASVIAYILNKNDMPAGRQALPAAREGLAPITILAVKP